MGVSCIWALLLVGCQFLGGIPNDDSVFAVSNPQQAAVAAFLQIFGETIGVRVQFNVLGVLADGAFHLSSPSSGVIWFFLPKVLFIIRTLCLNARQKCKKTILKQYVSVLFVLLAIPFVYIYRGRLGKRGGERH
jgi:hypothetical protein